MTLLRLLPRTAERFCERAGISVTFLTRVGFKTLNRLHVHRVLSAFETGTERGVAPESLLLGFDSLTDRYTLLGRSLSSSPHLALITALARGASLRDTDYARRLQAGTLSHGLPVTFDEAQVRRQFAERDREIATGIVQRVRTVVVGGSRYILDGKHRAAHALVCGAPVECADCTPILFESVFRYVYYVRPSRRPERFARHLEILGPVYDRAAGGVMPAPLASRT
jgi:hypothetical protein